MVQNCCNHNKTAKKCIRKSDNKEFSLPRRFSQKACKKGVHGFTMKSSCAPYNDCLKGGGSYSKAICILAPNKNDVTGTIQIRETEQGLMIEYEIFGLSDGLHGFHIHEYGDLSDGCNSACSHFNPFNKNHGGLHSKERHAGDLGNIESKNKKSVGKIYAKNLCLTKRKKTSILGRMFIVHDKEDDLGLGGNEESLKTGNAGARLACGVIGIKK
tara:strand:+ start:9409 stop:10050 length:642 start_codon:yes stop_codon:yes gene_type:complete